MFRLTSEVLSIVDAMSAEKNITKGLIMSAIEEAFAGMVRNYYGDNCKVVAKIDPKTGNVNFFQEKVVKSLVSMDEEISLEEAKLLYPDAKIDEVIKISLPDIPMQVIPASSIRHNIIDRLRSIEKEIEYNEYKKHEGEIVVGTVKKTSSMNTIVSLGGRAEAIIFREGLLKTDQYRPGDKLKAYIKEVKRSNYDCQVILTRTNNNFLAMLIAGNTIEVQDGMIEIKAIARSCGFKAKVAVMAMDGRLDAVGACIGARGTRIKPIVDELRGEKVDIVYWDRDIVNFAKNAITPARATYGQFCEEKGTVELTIPDDQLKLAIGKNGINVRLASQLIGCNITVIAESEKKQAMKEKFARDVSLLCTTLDVEEPVAQFLVSSNIFTPDDLVAVGVEKLIKSGVFNDEIATELVNRATSYIKEQKARIDADFDELKIDKSILEIDGMTPEIAVLLGKNGVKNTQDIADLSSDEFIEMCGDRYADYASLIVMSARKIAYGIE